MKDSIRKLLLLGTLGLASFFTHADQNKTNLNTHSLNTLNTYLSASSTENVSENSNQNDVLGIPFTTHIEESELEENSESEVRITTIKTYDEEQVRQNRHNYNKSEFENNLLSRLRGENGIRNLLSYNKHDNEPYGISNKLEIDDHNSISSEKPYSITINHIYYLDTDSGRETIIDKKLFEADSIEELHKLILEFIEGEGIEDWSRDTHLGSDFFPDDYRHKFPYETKFDHTISKHTIESFRFIFHNLVENSNSFEEFIKSLKNELLNTEFRQKMEAENIPLEEYEKYVTLNFGEKKMLYRMITEELYLKYKEYGDNITHGHTRGLSLDEWFSQFKNGKDVGNCYDYARIVLELGNELGDTGAVFTYGVHGSAILIIENEDGYFYSPELDKEFENIHDFHDDLPFIHVEHYIYTKDNKFAGEISSLLEDKYRKITIGFSSFDDPSQKPEREGSLLAFHSKKTSATTYTKDFFNVDLKNFNTNTRFFMTGITNKFGKEQGFDLGLSNKTCTDKDIEDGLMNFGYCFIGISSIDLTGSYNDYGGGLSEIQKGFYHNHNFEHFFYGSFKIGNKTKLLTRVGHDIFIQDMDKQRVYGHNFYQVGVKTSYFGIDIDAYMKKQRLIDTYNLRVQKSKDGGFTLFGNVKFQNIDVKDIEGLIPKWQAELGAGFNDVEIGIGGSEEGKIYLTFQWKF